MGDTEQKELARRVTDDLAQRIADMSAGQVINVYAGEVGRLLDELSSILSARHGLQLSDVTIRLEFVGPFTAVNEVEIEATVRG